MDIASELQRGLALHQQGDLLKAGEVYREILTCDPDQVDALNLLGVVMQAANDLDLAEDLLKRAIKLDPKYFAPHANLGNALQATGRILEAIEAFQKALALNPKSIETLNNLASALNETEQFDSAQRASDEALLLEPAFPQALINKGNSLSGLEQTEEAILCYREALEMSPDNDEALFNLGNAYVDIEDYDAAIIVYGKAVELDPENAEKQYNFGNALLQKGQYSECLKPFEIAIALNPGYVDALCNYASALQAIGQTEKMASHLQELLKQASKHQEAGTLSEASALYREVIEYQPAQVYALHMLGVVTYQLGSPHEAKQLLTKAIKIEPNNADIHNNLALILSENSLKLEALNHLNRAIELCPDLTEAFYNRGINLQAIDYLDEAESDFLEAIRLQPNHIEALYSLGVTQQMQNRLGEAIQTLKNGIKVEPNNPNLHWNLSLALLQNGEFEEGWREYEWRWKMPKFSVFFREVAAPIWDGQALAGKTLYIHAEQGLGDTIHFARYVPLAAKGGTKVIFECVPALISLLAGSLGSEDITVVSDAPVNCDAHAPLLSLPGILKTNLDTIPSEIPYLNPPPERVLKWSDAIREGSGTKVGLVWAGNTTYQNDFRRSIPFELISEILNIPGFRFYSLQIERLEAATAAINDGIMVDIGTGFSDFSDTASVISQLDLVISVDTSVAHLAGALGVPVWILLPRASDWRWLLNRSDSPWYPTMRLFRQPSPGEWEPVIREVTTALLKFKTDR